MPRDGEHDAAAEAKFSLDSIVGDDGNNYSAGEKQMLALCRALAKHSRVIVLVSIAFMVIEGPVSLTVAFNVGRSDEQH